MGVLTSKNGMLFCGLVSVAVWSAVNVAGTRLKDICPHVGEAGDPENWERIHKDVVNR